MVQGQKLKLTWNGTTIDAHVLLGSDDLKGLIVTFDCGLRIPRGGSYLRDLPLLFDEERETYVDLISRTEALIEWQ